MRRYREIRFIWAVAIASVTLGMYLSQGLGDALWVLGIATGGTAWAMRISDNRSEGDDA